MAIRHDKSAGSHDGTCAFAEQTNKVRTTLRRSHRGRARDESGVPKRNILDASRISETPLTHCFAER